MIIFRCSAPYVVRVLFSTKIAQLCRLKMQYLQTWLNHKNIMRCSAPIIFVANG